MIIKIPEPWLMHGGGRRGGEGNVDGERIVPGKSRIRTDHLVVTLEFVTEILRIFIRERERER